MPMAFVIVILITRSVSISYHLWQRHYGNEFRSRMQPTSVHCVHYVQYTAHRYTTSRKLRTVSCHVTTGKNFRVAVIEIARLYITIGCRTKVSIICIFMKSCKKSTSREHYVHRSYYRQKWNLITLITWLS